jgi:hypothetical protein
MGSSVEICRWEVELYRRFSINSDLSHVIAEFLNPLKSSSQGCSKQIVRLHLALLRWPTQAYGRYRQQLANCCDGRTAVLIRQEALSAGL